MRRISHERASIAVVAPTQARARDAALRIKGAGRKARFVPFSLDRLIGSSDTPRRVVLCPSGSDVADDLGFLREIRERLLWPAPPAAMSAAIEGLLGEPSSVPLSRASAGRPISSALLLEGSVTRARARRALESDVRVWIVERPERVRLSRRELERLSEAGVRWMALDPVRVAALLASPALAGQQARWRDLLPPRTPVWLWRGDG